MFNRRSGGWGSNSRFNAGWNQYGKLSYSPALQSLFVFTYIPRITEKNDRKLIMYKTGENTI